jgi:hypothetical protein
MSASTFPTSVDSSFAAGSTSSDGSGLTRELALHFVRTDAGDAELRQPGLTLATPARQLLFSIEHTLAIDLCISVAEGSSLADAMLLLRWGLIRLDSLRATGADRASARQLHAVVGAVLVLPASELYRLLTQQAKLRLGLLHGFRMILALERCVSHEDQRALAVRFVEDVWRSRGETGIRPLNAALRC